MHLVNLTEKIRMGLKPPCLLHSTKPFTEVNGNERATAKILSHITVSFS